MQTHERIEIHSEKNSISDFDGSGSGFLEGFLFFALNFQFNQIQFQFAKLSLFAHEKLELQLWAQSIVH